MSKKTTETPTAAEMKEELKALKKRIEERERDELLGPFIEMAIEARKLGRIPQLKEACRSILFNETITADQQTFHTVVPANIDEELMEDSLEILEVESCDE